MNTSLEIFKIIIVVLVIVLLFFTPLIIIGYHQYYTEKWDKYYSSLNNRENKTIYFKANKHNLARARYSTFPLKYHSKWLIIIGLLIFLIMMFSCIIWLMLYISSIVPEDQKNLVPLGVNILLIPTFFILGIIGLIQSEFLDFRTTTTLKKIIILLVFLLITFIISFYLFVLLMNFSDTINYFNTIVYNLTTFLISTPFIAALISASMLYLTFNYTRKSNNIENYYPTIKGITYSKTRIVPMNSDCNLLIPVLKKRKNSFIHLKTVLTFKISAPIECVFYNVTICALSKNNNTGFSNRYIETNDAIDIPLSFLIPIEEKKLCITLYMFLNNQIHKTFCIGVMLNITKSKDKYKISTEKIFDAKLKLKPYNYVNNLQPTYYHILEFTNPMPYILKKKWKENIHENNN